MFIQDESSDRSDAYRILSDLFSRAPQADVLEELREELLLASRDTPEEILTDFSSLLQYPTGKLPPVESLFDGNAQKKVAEFYTDAGLTIDEEFQLPSDHISLELLFVSYLIETNNPDLLAKFLDEHIMNWVPYYCEEVRRQASTGFYREVAEITKEFLENEYESL